MDFDDFWWHLLSSEIDYRNTFKNLNYKNDMQGKLDAFYRHLELELDEKQKHKDKKNVKLDKPSKRHLDNLIADYERSKLKREYLNKRMKTTSIGGEGFST